MIYTNKNTNNIFSSMIDKTKNIDSNNSIWEATPIHLGNARTTWTQLLEHTLSIFQ